MDLENKIGGNKISLFRKFTRKVMPYVLVAGLGLAVIGCQLPIGQISVQNTISPTSVLSGNYVYWEVKVTNNGDKVKINAATVCEECISGWARWQHASANLPITNNEIKAYSTETIFRMFHKLYNIPPYNNISNIIINNTVTVISDSGDDSETCTTYTIIKEDPKVDSGVVRALSYYLK